MGGGCLCLTPQQPALGLDQQRDSLDGVARGRAVGHSAGRPGLPHARHSSPASIPVSPEHLNGKQTTASRASLGVE